MKVYLLSIVILASTICASDVSKEDAVARLKEVAKQHGLLIIKYDSQNPESYTDQLKIILLGQSITTKEDEYKK